MKKIILFLLLFITPVYATEYGSYCSINNHSKSFLGVIMSTTGTNFLARQVAQKEIASALKKETGSDFNVRINSFWGTNIANGEFSKFSAVSKNYSHKNFSSEELAIKTLCQYNKVSYKNNKLNFDTNMVLKFDAQLNQDNLAQIIKQKVQIINDKIAFDYKISAFGIKTKLNLKAGLDIVDNKIKLCNIEFNNKLIDAAKYSSLLNKFTDFDVDLNKNTKANIKVDSVKIKNSKVYLSGFVFIPKN